MIYKCTNPRCHTLIRSRTCGVCNSRATAISDLHLTALGLDAYASLQVDGQGRPYLLIKKPSGQKRIKLNRHDFLNR